MPMELTPHARRAALLESADIRAWIKDHRSPSTARVQLEQLELFCRRTGIEAAALPSLATARPNKTFRGLVLDWVDRERKAGHPDQYLRAVWHAVRSWLRYHEVVLEWNPPLTVQPGATLDNERVPDLEELRRLLGV